MRSSVRQFTAEWNRLAREGEASRKTLVAELAGVERQLSNLVDALAQGVPVAALKSRMDALEARRAAPPRDVAVGGGAVPIRLHKGIAEVY